MVRRSRFAACRAGIPDRDAGRVALAMREGLRSIGVANATVAIFETLMNSRSLFLTANTESIYTVGWLDLRGGPLVVETPPNVLRLIDDFWFRDVCDIGNAGPDQGEGGKFLLLPPAYRGEVPAGCHVCRSNTFGNWLFIRGFMVDGDPAPTVKRVKATLRIYPLAAAASPPALTFVNGSGRSFNTIFAAGLQRLRSHQRRGRGSIRRGGRGRSNRWFERLKVTRHAHVAA